MWTDPQGPRTFPRTVPAGCLHERHAVQRWPSEETMDRGAPAQGLSDTAVWAVEQCLMDV